MGAERLPLFAEGIERRVLRDHVYDAVLDLLMQSAVQPGSRLSIEAIARDLRVSPTPVREALAQLERTGMVTSEAHKGYRVADELQGEQLSDLFDARLVLEGAVASFAAERDEIVLRDKLGAALHRHETAMHEMTQIASAHGASLPLDVVRRYFDADWAFHEAIFESAGNAFLLDMSGALSTRVHPMRRTIASGITDAGDAVREHRSILEAVRKGPDAVGEAMRAHIRNVQSRYLASLEKVPSD